jgi:putative flippase GtrA
MLLQAARHRIRLHRVPVRTIYLDDNRSSHFRPFADSIRIYAPVLAFVGTSLTAFVLDTGTLLWLHSLLGSLLPAVVLARVVSGSANFVLNRHLVFADGELSTQRWGAARRYAASAAMLLLANYLLLASLCSIGLPLLLAKLLTEVVLVGTSYAVQARYVFAHQQPAHM